jgi:hypothetical protein
MKLKPFALTLSLAVAGMAAAQAQAALKIGYASTWLPQ